MPTSYCQRSGIRNRKCLSMWTGTLNGKMQKPMVTSKNILAQEFRKDRWAFLSVCEKTDAADVFWNKPFQTVALNSACYLDIGTWVNFMALVADIHGWGLLSHISRPRYVWNKKEKKKNIAGNFVSKGHSILPLIDGAIKTCLQLSL